jgi:hypothetical protein
MTVGKLAVFLIRPNELQLEVTFLAQLQGDRLLAAKALAAGMVALRIRFQSIDSTVEGLDYRILHLKQTVVRLIA